MQCCRAGHSIKNQVLSIWYSKEPVIKQYIHTKNSFVDSDMYIKLPNGISAVTEITSVSLSENIIKYKLWKEGEVVRGLTDEEVYKVLHGDIQDAWLWIGASTVFSSYDMTNEIQPFIVAGNTITPTLLSEFFPWHYNWKYLDPLTFKEVDFPSSGLTINAPRVESIKETDKEVGSPK
jgi:hypothetical protein